VSAILDGGYFSSVCAESLQKVARNEVTPPFSESRRNLR
jgi:hypothetical protein